MARKKKERESSLHLTDKHHPLLGIVATLLAVLSAGMFGAACVAASGSNGHAGLLVGFVGICSLVVAGVGFVLAWISLHQEDIRPHFPTIASIWAVSYLLSDALYMGDHRLIYVCIKRFIVERRTITYGSSFF